MVITIDTNRHQRLENLMYPTLKDNLIEGMIIYNAQGEIVVWNKAAEKITGINFSQYKGKCCKHLPFGHYSEGGVPLCERSCPNKAAFEKNAVIEESLYFSDENDLMIPVLLNVIPIKDQNNQLLGTVQLFSVDSSKENMDRIYKRLKGKMDEYTDYIKELVQKNKALNKKLISLSYTDTLTGLYNRRYFYTEAQKALNKAIENNTLLTVLLMDIDFFKKINDVHGHLAGDEALKVVSSLVEKNSGKNSLVCRFGGEEFLVLIQGATIEKSFETAENIRSSIKSEKFVYEGTPIPLSISIGIFCQIPDEDMKIQNMTDWADQALYKAKEAGRNKCIVYKPE